MRGQLGDRAPPSRSSSATGFGTGWMSGEWICMSSLPCRGATLHPGFGATAEGSGATIPHRAMVFRPSLPGRPARGLCAPLGRRLSSTVDTRRRRPAESVKRKMQAVPRQPKDHCAEAFGLRFEDANGFTFDEEEVLGKPAPVVSAMRAASICARALCSGLPAVGLTPRESPRPTAASPAGAE